MASNILVIDDDADFALLFCKEAGKVNPDNIFLRAENGYRALHILNFMLPEVPGIIFVNVRMPIMSGIEIVKEIREMPEFAGVPVFMYSASEDPDERRKAIITGANGYYQKPFTTDSMQRMIQEVYGQRVAMV
jgi:CheY-like chemotaxis protein